MIKNEIKVTRILAITRLRAMYYNLPLFSVTRKSGKKEYRWNLMSEKVDPDGSTSSSYFAMIKISSRREERYDRGTRRRRKERRYRRRRKTNAGATCTGAGRTYGRTSGRRWDWVMTAFAPGGRLWTRRSGYSSYSLFLRLRPRRRNRRPCITFGSLRSGLLFGIVARPHRHHGPSRSHLSHRPGWNRRFHPPQQVESVQPASSIYVSCIVRISSPPPLPPPSPSPSFPFLSSSFSLCHSL